MLPNPASVGWTNVVYEMHEYQYNTTDANVQKGADNQVTDFNNHRSAYGVPCYIGEFNDFNYGRRRLDAQRQRVQWQRHELEFLELQGDARHRHG